MREVLISKLLTHVDDISFDCTGAKGLLANCLEAIMLLANLADHSDNVKVLNELEPLDANGSIQAARIGKNNFLFFLCHDVSSLRIIAPAMAHIFLQQLLQTIDERIDFILCANQRGKESQSVQTGCIQKQALTQCINGDLRGIKTFC